MNELDVPSVSQICESIVRGKYDQSQMDGIAQAITFRRQQLIPHFHVGDEVKFSARTKPSYLIGEKGTIIKVNTKRVKIRLERPIGRFGSLIMAPKSLLEVTKGIYDK